MCEATGTTQVNAYGNYTFYFLPWSVAGQTSITFNVSGCGTSCFLNVLLSSAASYPCSGAQTYLVGLSASAALTTAFIYPRLGVFAGSVAFSSTYWVSWIGGVISVGSGPVVGQGPSIVSYTDPVPSAVNFVAFSSNPSPVSYLVFVPGVLRDLVLLFCFCCSLT